MDDTIKKMYENDPNYTVKENELGTEISHPAYGMVAFSRQTGGNKTLFGSSVRHHDTIELAIRHGHITRGLHQDWYYGDDDIIRVQMSYSQFAEVITSLNCGTGVPCTIEWQAEKGQIPECDFINKRTQFTEEYKDLINSCMNEAEEVLKSTKEILEKKTISKADRRTIFDNMRKFSRMLSSNSDFMFQQFQEQMDKTITEAKGEIEAFTQNKLNAIASQALVEHRDELLHLNNPVDIGGLTEKKSAEIPPREGRTAPCQVDR